MSIDSISNPSAKSPILDSEGPPPSPPPTTDQLNPGRSPILEDGVDPPGNPSLDELNPGRSPILEGDEEGGIPELDGYC